MILLKTKLHIPTVRSEWVERPRLYNSLDQGFQRKLVLVSAPAGFGKTTLVTSWLQKRGMPAAWLSLDQDDNDSRRFWFYFIAALQTIEASVGEESLALLQSLPTSVRETVIPVLLNEICNVQARFFLVLDDFHVVENQQIQEDVMFLLDHLPPSKHLIISTRADPP